MVEVMKENHQEVDVVDMSGMVDEPRAERYEGEECAEEEACHNNEMDKMFIEGATKGIAMKVKSKKAGGKW